MAANAVPGLDRSFDLGRKCGKGRFRVIAMADEDRQISLATRVRRSNDLLATEVEGEMMMMDPEQGLYFGLDPIGTDIWKRMADPVLVADLVADLADDYLAPVAQVQRDVLALLSRMAAHGLISEC